MADLFISYAREDTARASAIASALEAEGFAVFWDSEIPAGQTWADYIETKLRNSAAVLVLWSATSTQSQWVREEARMGRDAGKLIPVQLDASVPPFGFGEVQAANLQSWAGDRGDAGWLRLVGAIRFAIEKNGQTPPPPRPVIITPAAAPPPAPPPPAPAQPAYAPQPAYAAPSPSAAVKPSGIKPIWIIATVGLGLLGLIAVVIGANSGGPAIQGGAGGVSYSQAGPTSAYVAPAVQSMIDQALQFEAEANQIASQAAGLYEMGASAASAGFAGQRGYMTQQAPDGTMIAGDLTSLVSGQPAAVGVDNPIGIQFYGTYQQLSATDYTMTGRGSAGSAIADGHWVYTASTFDFTGVSSLQNRYVVAGRETGSVTGAGGSGLGVITYTDGSRYVGEYRTAGTGDQAQYLRHGLGAVYAATGELMESGRYESDGWLSAE